MVSISEFRDIVVCELENIINQCKFPDGYITRQLTSNIMCHDVYPDNKRYADVFEINLFQLFVEKGSYDRFRYYLDHLDEELARPFGNDEYHDPIPQPYNYDTMCQKLADALNIYVSKCVLSSTNIRIACEKSMFVINNTDSVQIAYESLMMCIREIKDNVKVYDEFMKIIMNINKMLIDDNDDDKLINYAMFVMSDRDDQIKNETIGGAMMFYADKIMNALNDVIYCDIIGCE